MAVDFKKKMSEAAKVAKNMADNAGQLSGEVAKVATEKGKELVVTAKDKAVVAKDVGLVAVDKGKALTESTKKAVIEAIDENGNGEIDIEDIIIKGFKTPGVRINRSNFLRKELFKHYPEEVINDAIEFNPAHAGITPEELSKIADSVIQNERLGVSGISAALGTPGGAAMAVTVPADIIQYYGYMLRAAQEMLYLYGFPELDIDANTQQLDSETVNMLILCLGTMYGVASAKNALLSISKALGKGISTKIMKTALTKGAVYPVIKEVAKWFGVKMTKSILAGAVEKSMPVVGGVLGGAITYASFKPCCDKLKASLSDTELSNPGKHISTKEEDNLVIDIEVCEVETEE